MKNQTKESKSWGVASLVVSILGLLCFIALVLLILAIMPGAFLL